ncbi:MAG: hypothetical protein JWM95_2981 [Gemmatimonadetes bacterium]|nr:hypothetical protein [Gemmatimonadota bacterium]
MMPAAHGRTHDERRGFANRLLSPDVLIPLAISAILLLVGVRKSMHKYMWYDELATWHLVTDNSFRHLVAALTAGADAAPPTYHTLAHWWTLAAGDSALSLRLFSCLGIIASMWIFWMTLRRVFSWPATAVAVLSAYLTALPVLHQTTEIRYYGLILVLFAAALNLALRLGTEEIPSLKLLAANSLVHAVMSNTHLFGGIYGGVLLLALMIGDALRGRPRWRVYASFFIGWLLFLFYLPILKGQRSVTPYSWMMMPGAADLIESYEFGMTSLPLSLFAAVLLPIVFPVSWQGRRGGTSRTPGSEARATQQLLLLAGCALLIPLISFVISHTVVIIFYDRYFIPGTLGLAVVFAWIVDTGERSIRAHLATDSHTSMAVPGYRKPLGIAVGAAFLLALAGGPFLWLMKSDLYDRPGATIEPLLTGDLRSLPVAVESRLAFLQLDFYPSPAPRVNYVFLTDSTYRFDPVAELEASVYYGQLMQVYRDFGYRPGANVFRAAEFYRMHPRFVVVDSRPGRWFQNRIEADTAAFTHQFLGLAKKDSVWLVTVRNAGGSAP